MGTKLPTPRGKNLYEFWGDSVTQEINQRVMTSKSEYVLNLASKEYFSVVNTKLLAVPVVSPIFKDVRKGVPKVISFLAKRARGAMARYVVSNQIQTPEGLTRFREGGYQYQPDLSTPIAPVFIRPDSV